MSKTNTTTATPAAPKPQRIISPAIQALRDEHKAKVDQLNKTQASAKILKAILEADLPKMTDADKATLRTHLEVPAVNPTKA